MPCVSPTAPVLRPFLIGLLFVLCGMTDGVSADEPKTRYREGYYTRDAALESISEDIQNGTLLFSEGDCVAVKCFTRSAYTHVAIVVMKEGQPFVYDSAKGGGVRCQDLASYVKFLGRDDVHLFQPTVRFSRETVAAMRDHLEGAIGTPYAVKHHLTGNRSDGVHCAEYVTDALMAADLISADRPPKVSPKSLASGVTAGDLYEPVKTVSVLKKSQPKSDGGRCARLWSDTKHCSKNCWLKVRGWVACR